mmetsp:Transcript_14372/g.36356  ORF Transcript_14372/g.36356 Transcript_14372/m.36356 type:complete len:200 (-) Transcript_14372:854-1453(-)
MYCFTLATTAATTFATSNSSSRMPPDGCDGNRLAYCSLDRTASGRKTSTSEAKASRNPESVSSASLDSPSPPAAPAVGLALGTWLTGGRLSMWEPMDRARPSRALRELARNASSRSETGSPSCRRSAMVSAQSSGLATICSFKSETSLVEDAATECFTSARVPVEYASRNGRAEATYLTATSKAPLSTARLIFDGSSKT